MSAENFDAHTIDADFSQASTWDDRMPERTRWLRENAPVFWSEKTGAYVLTRFEDVSYVSKNSDLFCSGEGVLPGRIDAKIGLIDEDEPRHGEMRGLINRGFTPRMVRKWEDVFQAITDEALDKIASKGECDFVDDIAVPLPLILIAEMIGIRREDRERFHRWSDAMIQAQGNLDNPEIVAASGQAAMEYMTYVTEIIEDRRKTPKEDLISILVRAKDEGMLVEHDEEIDHPEFERSADHRAMNRDELIKMSILLMVAGNETTRNGLSGGMALLIENPEARQRLIDDPSLIPQAIEEMLRLVSPVLSFQRTATRDTELRGVPIKQGERVLMLYGSANRDEREFADPDRYDLHRRAPRMLAFGQGAHMCIGHHVAKMEAEVALRELLSRAPEYEILEDRAQRNRTEFVQGWLRLPATFEVAS